MKIKKNDKVKILAGKDKGKTGKVMKVCGEKRKILVEGINVLTKHKRPTKKGEKGEIVHLPRPIDVSNAMLVCQTCNQATRVGYKLNGDKKLRYCKKCQSMF